MPVIEFEGKTTEEAIEKACANLHLAKDELKFQIITTGSSGIFGIIASKKAKIKVTVEEKVSESPEKAKPSEEIKPKESAPASQRQPKEQRRRKKPSKGLSAEAPKPGSGDAKSDKPDENNKTTAASDQLTPADLASPTVAGPDEELHQGPEDATMTQAREALEGILSRMQLDTGVTVSRINSRLILDISGDNSGLLIGKKGATLDALQYIVSKVVNRSNEERNHIIVDTSNYRGRRHDTLVSLGQRMAKKALKTRKPVAINGLSAHDRRIIHMTLKNETEVSTKSRGDGAFKKVVIIPHSAKSNRSRKQAPGKDENGKTSDNENSLESLKPSDDIDLREREE